MQVSNVKVIRIPVRHSRASLLSTKKRVCAYCRVSTNEEEQVSSYELQVQHYTELIQHNAQWEFVGVYADYAKSGTSTRKRTEFLRMIKDCKEGKIDLVITKSISRFARNTLDCLNYVRELQSLTPPVTIVFEKENINTLDSKSELLLTLLSSIAQDEARSISENLKWSLQKRFQEGKARCPTRFLLGFEQDENGNLVINEEEATSVRRVYREYMEGKGARVIAAELKAEGVLTGRGTTNWGKSSVMHILRNEKYCGDVLMQKNITLDFLTHKRVENQGQLPQYYLENHHPAIIPRNEWNAVQAEIKYRYEIANTKDCNIRQGYSNASVFSNHLFCGQCGQPVIKKSLTLTGGGKKENVSVWMCRATSAKACRKRGYVPCSAKRHYEPKIKEAFIDMLLESMKKGPDLKPSDGNDGLIKIFRAVEEGTAFKDRYFRELIDRGVVYDDGRIDYTFKNGLTCTSFIKNEKRRTKKSNSKSDNNL